MIFVANMIPKYIDQEDPRRNGERLVFDWLSDRSVEGTAYYSLHQKNHRFKLISEIDFLFVSERGFICIEVKGGQDIYRKDRQWFSVNKKGISNPINNPFEQAIGCQYALKEYFESVYGKFSRQSKYLVGYAVIFPECCFTGTGNDLVTEVVFDCKYNLKDFPDFLNKVFDYWEKQEIDKHRFTPTNLTTEELRQANDLLRGDFCVVPSMNLELQHTERKMIQLTEEQYDVLEDIEENHRAIVFGAAGTGKSLLALQLVIKTSAKEKRVLYLCFNKNMAAYARNSIEKSTNIDIFTYHSFAASLLSKEEILNQDVRKLSRNILNIKDCIKEKYDLVIIDEGQDLFYAETIDVLDKLIENGLSNGEWAIFMDPNQNIFNDSSEFDFTLEYLKSICHPIVKTLRINCRNTEQIARRTSILTSTPHAKYLKVSGPKVVTKKYESKRDFLKQIKEAIMSLLASGINAKDIVILSPRKKCNSVLSGIDSICNLSIVEKIDISTSEKNSINYYTVQSFKGLESKIVFYVDMFGFESLENRMLNYVGMSRAQIRLYLFFDLNLTEEYSDAIDKGEDLLL